MRHYWRTIPEWGWVYTIDDFRENVRWAKISPKTGYGYFAKEGLLSDAEAFDAEPEDATHVIWFEK